MSLWPDPVNCLFMKALIIASVTLLWIGVQTSEARPIKHRRVSYPVETKCGPVLTRSGLVRLAMADLGVTEGSDRADELVRLCGFKSSRRTPWCAASVSDWLIRAGHRISRTASVSDLRKQLGRYDVCSVARPGTIVFFRYSHVGVVVAVGPKGFESVEGNASGRVRKVYHKFNAAEAFVKV